MNKKILLTSILSSTLIFTACSDDANNTSNGKQDVLSAQHTNPAVSDQTENVADIVSEGTKAEESSTQTETVLENNPKEEGVKNSEETGNNETESSTSAKNLEENDSGVMETNRLNEKVMKVDKEYKMKQGETIIPMSENPKIVLKTDTQTGETTATLLDGEAKIKKSLISFR